MNKFEDLHIWNKSMDLVERTYKVSNKLSADERYGLISQMRRCSISIPSNIAEGAGRNSDKEFKHFLSIANGSVSELKTQLLLVLRLEFLKEEEISPLLDLCNEIQKMSRALQNKLGTNV